MKKNLPEVEHCIKVCIIYHIMYRLDGHVCLKLSPKNRKANVYKILITTIGWPKISNIRNSYRLNFLAFSFSKRAKKNWKLGSPKVLQSFWTML